MDSNIDKNCTTSAYHCSRTATDRNALALDRTILANERTYAAWIRTGLAALASGLGVEGFMLHSFPAWGMHIIANIFLLFSAISFLLAGWRYQHLRVKLTDIDVDMVPFLMIKIISNTLAFCAFIAILAVWRIGE